MSELNAIRSSEIYNIIEYEDCYRTDDLYYSKSEADKVIAEKVATLEEAQRWRKCSDEMPQKYDDGDCFLIAVEHESTTCPKRYYVTIAELVGGKWNDDEGEYIDEDIEYDLEGTKKGFYRNKVTHWMPLPSAPKEAK